MIFIERASERRREPLFREPEHFDDDEPARRRRAHLVADGDGMTRLDARTVELHVTPCARIARERPRFEQPRCGKPLIDANGKHAN